MRYCIVTNDLQISFCVLVNCIVVVLSDTNLLCFGNFIPKYYIVKIILISFNCFSEYTIGPEMRTFMRAIRIVLSVSLNTDFECSEDPSH